MPINATVGRARVIEIHDPRIIRIGELEPHHPAKGERILFKTANSRLCWKTPEFNKDFVHIPPETARYLAEAGIRTIGIDYLSVGTPKPAAMKRIVSCSAPAFGLSKA